MRKSEPLGYSSWSTRAPSSGKKGKTIDFNWKPYCLAIAVVLIIGELLFFFAFPSGDWYAERRNELAVGPEAKASRIDVPIYKTEVSHPVTVGDMWKLREKHAEEHPELFSGTYKRLQSLLLTHPEDAPWLSLQDKYYFGNQGDLHDGVPADLFTLENPYLLIHPEFTTFSIRGNLQWNTKAINSNPTAPPVVNVPFRPEPEALTWFPDKARAEVVYDLSHFMRMVGPY